MAFKGFPADGFKFLEELAEHNEKAWFEANKARWQKSLLEPAQAFVEALGSRLKMRFPAVRYDTRTNGQGSMQRIYRDTRFSADKSPYKTWMGISFPQGEKKEEHSGFYVHLETKGVSMCGGMHCFSPETLATYRSAVADDKQGKKLAAVVGALQERGMEIHGESYKRVPSGFPATHPRSTLLKHASIYVTSPVIDRKKAGSADLIDVCMEWAEAIAPLNAWLDRMS